MREVFFNPWMGLSAYKEPENESTQYLFCGRTHDTRELTRLIDDNLFVTLYGMSGIGKTSLINAGVFPQIRKMNYLPITLRLGLLRDEDNIQDLITKIVRNIIKECNGTIETNKSLVPTLPDINSDDYLWSFFIQNHFYDFNHKPIFPLFVFDQFEEVFRKKTLRNKTILLLKQINYLIDETHSINYYDEHGSYEYDNNYRFLVSIREDDLYKLEEIIDDDYLYPLKNVRYRLKPMTVDGATEVILKPGKSFFYDNEQQSIANCIIKASIDEWGNICTNLISLICSRLYEAFKKSNNSVRLKSVEEFITNDLFSILYGEATTNLTEKERIYIEEHLIDSSGRRDSISENDFLQNIPNGISLLEDGPNKILQKVAISSDADRMRIELLHDSFCQPILEQIKGRKRTQISVSVYANIVAWSLMILGLIAIVYELFGSVFF